MSVTSARDWAPAERTHSDRVLPWVTGVTVALLVFGFSRSRASYPGSPWARGAQPWPTRSEQDRIEKFSGRGEIMDRDLLLWLIGIPIVFLIWAFGEFH
jgi:hypothetical protein